MQVAARGGDRLQARHMSCGGGKRVQHGRGIFDCVHAGFLGDAQREGATARKQIGDILCARDCFYGECPERFFAERGRLQKRAGGRGYHCRAHAQTRRL